MVSKNKLCNVEFEHKKWFNPIIISNVPIEKEIDSLFRFTNIIDYRRVIEIVKYTF